MQRLALEVLAQGPVARLIVLQRVVAVRAQGAGQHGNVPEHALERLVQDVGQLVLKVLRGDERVQQITAKFSFHCFNLAARAGDVGVGVEGLPEMVQSGAGGAGADVEQDADIRVERLAEGVKEPAVRVELLLVLLLEAEDHLAGHDALLGALELQVRVERDLRRVLVHVRLDGLLVDVVLCDAVLVHAHGGEGVEGARVNLFAPVRDDTHDDLLPAHLAPGAAAAAAAEVADVLHDGVHGAREAVLVLVVHGDADEELRLARGAPDALPQLVAAVGKVVRVARHGRVSHVRELDLVAPREEAIQDRRDLALEHQLAVDQLHLAPAHLGCPHATPLLLALGRRPGSVPVRLLVPRLLRRRVLAERHLRRRVRVTVLPATAKI